MSRPYLVYVICWILRSSVCQKDVNEITSKAMSVVSETIIVNRSLESTSVPNPKDFTQGFSTLDSFTTTTPEVTLSERSTYLKHGRPGFLKNNPTGQTPNTMEADDLVCVNQRESCSGLCNVTNAVFHGTKCSCDIHCKIYKTCCKDFKHSCPDLWLEAHQTYGNLIHVNVKCLESYSSGYLVIAGCPNDNQVKDDDRNKCENSSLEQPISVSDIHFKNIYCLRCNGYSELNGLLWKTLVYLHAENFGKWRDGPDFLKFDHHSTFVKWNPPNANIKECSKSIIDSCPDNTAHYLASRCKRIHSYVKVLRNNSGLFDFYNNIHCIQCNIGTNIPCQVITALDFNINKFSHLSTLVTWTSSPDLTSHGIFEGSSRTKWKKMNCKGIIQNWSSLQCSVTECWNELEPVNGICPRPEPPSCILFVIKWNSIYLNDDYGADDNVIPSAIKKLLKIYIQNVYNRNNSDVWATNSSVAGSLTIFNGKFLSIKDRKKDIIPIISMGLSKEGFQGEFSLCIIRSFLSCQSIRGHCLMYTNYTISEISSNKSLMVKSSAEKINTVSYCMVVILIRLAEIFQRFV